MEVFSTPSYRRMMERQKEELDKLHSNDVDVFVRIVNQAKREPPEVQYPVSIGWKPETVAQVRRVEKKKLDYSYDQGFWGGLMLAGMVVLMVVMVLVMP